MTDTHTDATALEALAVRVEGGETGREIDAHVCNALQYGGQSYDIPNHWRIVVERDADGTPWIVGYQGDLRRNRTSPAAVSISLDAVAALAERVLPGHYIEVSGPRKYLNIPTPVPNYWKAVLSSGQHGFSGVDWIAWAPTECAARLAAILRAAKGA